MTTELLLAFATGYLLGSIPTSFWLGRALYGVDLRREGSGNLGATNTFRVLGWKAALPVVLVDVGKGWLPVWLLPSLDVAGASWAWALAYGAAAGVAMTLGMLLVEYFWSQATRPMPWRPCDPASRTSWQAGPMREAR